MNVQLHLGDCLSVMPTIEAGSVDCIICDLPYGTTALAWDSVIPLTALWDCYRRVLKPTGAVILFGSQPFTSALVMSNPEWFKYEWIWEKGRPSGFMHAKNKPMKAHENILVFINGTTVHEGQSETRMTYNPQIIRGNPYKRVHKAVNACKMNHAPAKAEFEYVGTVSENEGVRSPRSVQFFSMHNVGNLHPTEKPVPLLMYLIETYTNEGYTVLDNCFGSGSCGVACVRTLRNFIGVERDESYFCAAKKRIEEAQAQGNLFA